MESMHNVQRSNNSLSDDPHSSVRNEGAMRSEGAHAHMLELYERREEGQFTLHCLLCSRVLFA